MSDGQQSGEEIQEDVVEEDIIKDAITDQLIKSDITTRKLNQICLHDLIKDL